MVGRGQRSHIPHSMHDDEDCILVFSGVLFLSSSPFPSHFSLFLEAEQLQGLCKQMKVHPCKPPNQQRSLFQSHDANADAKVS
jgi:hypothetical protein